MRIPLIIAVFAAGPLFAVGSETETPPTPTETTQVCEEGTVWNPKTESCAAPEEAHMNQEMLYETARELAWAGRLDDAKRVLFLMEVSDKSLTYQGFVARKSGNWSLAVEFYQTALTRNPDNLLARSYYGQGLAARGDHKAAQEQLSEIRARGGRQTWAEVSLKLALRDPATTY